jgi:hypothetical protein
LIIIASAPVGDGGFYFSKIARNNPFFVRFILQICGIYGQMPDFCLILHEITGAKMVKSLYKAK